jgi:hypothetical protein
MSSHRREGPIARTIEEETSQIPSDMFLWAAGAAAGTAMLLRFMGRDQTSTFIGQWVPSILICGVYNKIVKTHGHDREDVEEFRLRRR